MTLKLLSASAAGRRIQRSASRAVQLDREGVMPAFRDSAGRRLWHEADVVAYLQKRDGTKTSQSTGDEAA